MVEYIMVSCRPNVSQGKREQLIPRKSVIKVFVPCNGPSSIPVERMEIRSGYLINRHTGHITPKILYHGALIEDLSNVFKLPITDVAVRTDLDTSIIEGEVSGKFVVAEYTKKKLNLTKDGKLSNFGYTRSPL